MGGVSSTVQSPSGVSNGTVEPTTVTSSYDVPTNSQPEVTPNQILETARQPAVKPYNRLSWRPTHKFGQVEEYCFHSRLHDERERIADRQQQLIFLSTPEPDVEILMTSSSSQQSTSQLTSTPSTIRSPIHLNNPQCWQTRNGTTCCSEYSNSERESRFSGLDCSMMREFHGVGRRND